MEFTSDGAWKASLTPPDVLLKRCSNVDALLNSILRRSHPTFCQPLFVC